jgi:uncharacterized protein
MEQFLCFLRPTRENFIQTSTQEESAIVGEHFAYLQELLAEGKLILAGRTQTDAPVGISIFCADSLEQAHQIAQIDPAVVKGVFHAEVHPFSVALMKGQE